MRARILVWALILCLIPFAAFAKTQSTAIDPPEGTVPVFTITVGETTFTFTWGDLTGATEAFVPIVEMYLNNVDGAQVDQEWTGVPMSVLIAFAAELLEVTIPEDAIVTVLTADDFPTQFPLQDVLNPDWRYLVALDPVANADGDNAFPDSFVRIVRGEPGMLSNQANLRCVVGIVIEEDTVAP